MALKDQLTRAIGKGRLTLKKNSPEILLVSGIISGGVALAFAIKSTLEVESILDDHAKRMERINNVEDDEEIDDGKGHSVVVTPQVKKRLVALQYGKTALSFTKLYAPTIIFAGLSLTCILTSHGIMRKRNLALAASLATVRTAFDEYRSRVVRDLGKEMDNHFLYDTVEETVERKVVDENGKEKIKKEKIQKPQFANAYSRIFDNCNAPDQFEKDGSANYIFIRAQMLHLQDKLKANGYLFLNDVYKALNFPITLAGQTAGWIYDYNDPENTQIFFEGFDVDEVGNSPAVRDLMNGYENSIIINFLNIKDDILTDIPRVDSRVDVI